MSKVRKQLYLSVEQNDRLQSMAARERRSEAEVVREALDQYFGKGTEGKKKIADDPLWKIVGIGSSPKGDLSERVDELLYRKPCR